MHFVKQLIFGTAFFLFTIHAKAQNANKYDALWKKVDELHAKQGLTRSALAEVKKIYNLAKKENQRAQVIKALIYQVSLQESTEDETIPAGFGALEQEIAITPEPGASILRSILAEKTWTYFQQRRWQLYNRTQTTAFVKEDMSTWAVSDFHERISALYILSIKNKKTLQQTSLAPYNAIIIKGNARHLRPTLYDLLAHRALDYFRNDERDITKPAYAFEIRNEAYFQPALAFSRMPIVSNDSLSLHHKALLIYQELLVFHASDTRPDAFIDADLDRISFLHQHGVMENKDSLYMKALEQVTATYKDAPAAAQAWYLLAQWHADKAAGYIPLQDTSNRYEYLKARAICEKLAAQKTETEGRSNAVALLQNILQRELSLMTEKVNIPGQPFRSLIGYRNFQEVFFRIIPLTENLRNDLRNRYDDVYWNQLSGLKPLRIWNQPLPATGDLQRHAAEVKIDALPVGSYILLASAKADFPLAKNVLAVQFFHVSSISYINNGDEYFVLDRESGKPLARAGVQVWLEKYDYAAKKNALSRLSALAADENGHFEFRRGKNRGQNIHLEIKYQKDRLFLDDQPYYDYRWQDDAVTTSSKNFEKEKAAVFLFTDRSIYRPGQTVFFKGIAITKDAETKQSRVYPNQKTIIKLYNANGEAADSLELTTNEFGSYSGKFILPKNLLNGEFRLTDTGLKGDVAFAVEEYKRPAFYVDFEELKGTYKLNDSITLASFAKAYAGNTIGGAAVKYRVVREVRFIYPWMFSRSIFPRVAPMEISNGIAATDASGKLTIRFKAIPDPTLKKELDPVFDYRVIVDVTDINGETRTGEKSIPVSYKALQLKLGIVSGATVPLDSLKNLSISTQNLNGVFEPSLVQVVIHRLQAPARLVRKRFWPQPDQFVMSQEEFLRMFPYDEYRNETSYEDWSKGEKVFDQTDSTKPGSVFPLQNAHWTQGWHIIEVSSRDKFGEMVKDVKYIQVLDEKSSGLPAGIMSWVIQKQAPTEPGETATITIGSAAKDLFVIQQIDHNREPQAQDPIIGFEGGSQSGETRKSAPGYRFIRLDHEKKSFAFTATGRDRGGFGVNHFFVKHNRFYWLPAQVNVPWTNKELTVTYQTFRDKTLPGSGEQWKLQISGHKNEKLASEMLLSMYDASLDQFRPHQWSVPGIWSNYPASLSWNGNNSFNAVQSQERIWEENRVVAVEKRYDHLLSLDPRNRLYAQRNLGGRESASGLVVQDVQLAAPMANERKAVSKAEEDQGTGSDGIADASKKSPDAGTPQTDTDIRKNFNETAFFFPELRTDPEGNISFSFTMPEALTRWKLQGLAHTKEAAFGYTMKEVLTQKQLMVQPNIPRFLREGDRMQLSTKIANLSDREITGTVQLELLDALTLQPVDGWFKNMTANQFFTAPAGESVAAGFTIEVPYHFRSGLVYRFIARSSAPSRDAEAAAFSDGEEASIPVLTNAQLVTETMPLRLRGNAGATFRFEKLINSDSASETLRQHALTVEFSTNPAWYAVQSLSFLAEAKQESADEVFNRYYANALASRIVKASPRIRAVFEKWRNLDTSALLSALQKNEELKAVLLQETPWVLEAKDEARQKKDIALLFDTERMLSELEATLAQLKKMQSPNGGFVWFPGGRENRFITQTILTGMGRLKKLEALPAQHSAVLTSIINAGLRYLDEEIKNDYADLKKHKADLSKSNTGYHQVQYLYLRSFFPDKGIPGGSVAAANYFRHQAQQFWPTHNRYMQGMIALSLQRTGDGQTATRIIRSLQENAIQSTELGMYWKDNRGGYFWYQAPIETQSLLIEAFSEIGKDTKVVDDLKTWLLSQKQTRSWKTSRATADACYALLLEGTDWLAAETAVEIQLGDKKISSSSEKQEAGTGYFKKTFDAPFINPSMGEVSVKFSGAASSVSDVQKTPATPVRNGASWGAVYWQYFENLDKISAATTPLRLVKKLFVEKNTDRGPVLVPVTEGQSLKQGDKVKVRIEIRADRDMEYIHMKDMRASCMEPVNVISAYKWQGGLGYYETTGDASTNFYFDWLPKGTHVFEYALFVGHNGNFSNGITSIQCMYAPEFSSHSEGIRVNVE